MAVDKSIKADYEIQGKVKNYLGKQKMVKAPVKWKSGPDHPDTELAYITKAEKNALIKMNMYGSMNGKANKGPSGIISLNGWGDSGRGTSDASYGGGNVSGGGDNRDYGGGAAAEARSAQAAASQEAARVAAVQANEELTRQREMRDLIVQQQKEKDYIDIIDKKPVTDFDESPATLQGQLKLDEYQQPNTGIDKLVGGGLNMILPGAGYLYNAPFNPYKASNFFQGTGIQDLDENALLSGSVSPEDAAAYRAGTYGQPTTTGGDNQPTTGGDNQPIIGGGGPDVMPTTPSYVNPTGIASIPMDNQTTSGYNEQQDFVDNTYRQNLLDFFKGTGYTGLYG
jgi:hypothetical protein